MRRLSSFIVVVFAIAALSCSGPKDGKYSITLLTTNDVHGTFFDSTYVGGNVKKSLYGIKYVVDSIRKAEGPENVLLVDAGDIVQGDNAAYYFNYVDTLSPHIYPRLAKYMGYDAVVLGNHDIEAGHPVYDRLAKEMKAEGIPLLAGNAVRNDNGQRYFPIYTIVKRHGLKIAVLGYDNANIAGWLPERLWSGMKFQSLIPLVQQDVDMVVSKEKPHLVVVAVHTATGDGDGKALESQGLDLMKTLHGVDFLVCSHDHRPKVVESDTLCLINSGSHSRFVGHGKIEFTVTKGKVVDKKLSADLLPVDQRKIDHEMAAKFHDDFVAVKKFTTTKVGDLKVDLLTRDAYVGMSPYLNLIHTLSLENTPARISFAAPLTFNGTIKAGTLVYNDLFTVYPFENQMYVIKMTGKEIKDYLEASYDLWINTISKPTDHVLNIVPRSDARTGAQSWSFVERSYNFDSAGGLVYTVDVLKPRGERVDIESLAGGEPFDPAKTYNVALTSYRASGGGGLMAKAGVDTGKIDERVVEIYPEFRKILYDYLLEKGSIDPEVIGDPKLIGRWRFVPEDIAGPALQRDMELVFPKR
ncbi:MAG: bifunctional metallophosphatase/5'-nucleotidase [Bacteroidales bacterium]|nr:bifunctional metallophosphatase/5'-nucleotidase [Bacteroidales bacterium]